MPDEAFNEVVQSLYGASTDPEMWPVFLEGLAGLFEGVGAHILHVDLENQDLTFSVLYGYDRFIGECYALPTDASPQQAFERFEEHFTRLTPTDPRMEIYRRYPGKAVACREMFDEEVYHQSAMYREINIPANVEYSLVVGMPGENGYMTGMGVFRGREGPPFSPRETETFSALIPFLKQAIELQRKFALLSFEKQMGLDTLDSLPLGIFIVNGDCKILHANSYGQTLLHEKAGLSVVGETLAVANLQAEKNFRLAVCDIVEGARNDRTVSSRALNVPLETEQAGSLIIYISPLNKKGPGPKLAMFSEPLALLFVSGPGRAREMPEELLQRLYGLTPSEARLTARLVAGMNLNEAASATGISKETSRTYLKQIFAKTDTHRQTELVAAILRSPLWVGLSENQR